MKQTITILNLPFLNTTNADFKEILKKRLEKHQNTFIVTANPEIAVYAYDHPQYLRTIQQADYITPDGIGIIKASKQLQHPLQERITGFDTLINLLAIANQQQLKIYLLGARPEVICKTVANILQHYPQIQIVGYHDGYFQEEQPIIEKIKQTHPQIVAVALGFPKQEEFIAKYRQASPAIWIGVGGSFDVLSGTVKRAPQLFQKLHLEWLYRFLAHPSRLNRFMTLPRFLKLVKQHQ